MTYKSILVARRGGPEVLQIVENQLRPPQAGEVRIRTLAASVTLPEVEARYGHSPFPPKIPFTPGYAIVGEVEEYFMGQTALIIGASGGIGTALLQLGNLIGLKMYGLASESKHAALVEYGAVPIDYKNQDFVQVMRQAEPGGLDVIFDGMGGDYLGRGSNLLRRGGQWVSYANPFSRAGMLRLLGNLFWLNLPHTGRKLRLYGTGASFLDMRPFQQDWAALFKLLGEGKIAPVIAAKFPLLEAAKANALLESGQVTGNVVLLAEELLDRVKEE